MNYASEVFNPHISTLQTSFCPRQDGECGRCGSQPVKYPDGLRRNVRVVFSFVERMGQGECMAIGVEKVERLKCLVAELEKGEDW
ncbi:hypothetical protein BJ508DRAFT_417069 [Ascobolus immersus RN42]|uniref:Uncharacterized protein n=1 Tax=Ascobolus immersus RN42 TaxID=1160509 RepID=A0A3N4I6P7_ASCIM|nr:hypothetical protein BJ508DRAFT_417069 [Ascobolus immersus RN42]